MIYPVFSIRDDKAGFGQPQVSLNEPTMIRSFGHQINQPGSILEYAPSDYSLYEIGSFNTDSGEFKPVLPRFVISGIDVYGVSAK